MDAIPPVSLRWMCHQHLNNCLELTHLCKANADFVKVYESEYNLEVNIKGTMRFFIDQDWERFSCPNCRLGKTGLFETFLEGLCLICGSNEHSAESCERVSLLTECTYNHGRVKTLLAHSLQMCLILHHFCGLCFMSGHDRSVQTNLESTKRELCQRFLISQAEGLLTCLPLLCSSEQVRVKMQPVDWCFGLRGMPFRRDSVSRYFLRIPLMLQFGSKPDLVC